MLPNLNLSFLLAPRPRLQVPTPNAYLVSFHWRRLAWLPCEGVRRSVYTRAEG